jgi:hypothetical protein
MMKKTTLSLMMTLSLLGVEPAFASNAVLAAPAATTSSLGGFTALWTGNRLQIKSGSRVIWESVAAESFLRAGTQQLDAHELRGSFTTTENIVSQCTDQTITSFTQSSPRKLFLKAVCRAMPRVQRAMC